MDRVTITSVVAATAHFEIVDVGRRMRSADIGVLHTIRDTRLVINNGKML
jgi:hypothetical protein